MNIVRFSIGLVLVCVLFSGCASQPPSFSEDPVCLPNTLTVQAMEASQTVLGRMHFDIEKYDVDDRYLRTRPLSGAQFFEPWRKDNASASAAAQANLYSLRRIVELEFVPEHTTTCIQCRVQVLRLSVPEAPFLGSRWHAGIYTKSKSSRQTLGVDSHKQEEIEWIDAGSDPALANKILRLIQREIETGVHK